MMFSKIQKNSRLFATMISLLFASQVLQSSRLEAQVELEDVMKDMDTVFENLKREFTDPSKKDSSLLKSLNLKS